MNSPVDLVEVFTANLAKVPAGFERESLKVTLAATIESATLRWEPLSLDVETFVAFIAERVPDDATDLTQAVTKMHTDSLYLACACAAGDEQAIARFEKNFYGAIRPAVRRLDKTGTITDDALQKLRERLFLKTPERNPKVADYAGRGELRMWVRAVAVRIALDLLRTANREHRRREDDAVLDALPEASEDPEIAYLREHYGEALRDALASSLAAMPPRDRAVLRCHFVDRINIEQIGRIYQVHKTTAFRWLEKARHALIKATRLQMKDVLGVQTAELDSVMRLIDSELNLSLRRLLKDK